MNICKMIIIGTAVLLFWAVISLVGGTQAAPPDAGLARPALAQVTLNPTDIAFVSSGFANSNYGGRGYVWVGYGPSELGGNPTTTRGLVRFSLSSIPANATITAAELRATISITYAHGTGAFTYNVARADGSWSASSVTWNNQPARYGPIASARVSATSATATWTSSTLRQTVQDWVRGTRTNYGLYLRRENDTTDRTVHDRRFSNLQLVVTYETATPTPTPTPYLTKQDLQDPVNAGEEVEYLISGSARLSQTGVVDIVDYLPRNTTFVEASNGGIPPDPGTIWIRSGSRCKSK